MSFFFKIFLYMIIFCVSDFTDASAYWMFPYDTNNMRQEVDEVWEQVTTSYLWYDIK